MDVFRATFRATKNDLAIVRSQFIREFGEETYNRMIWPYVLVDFPGFIWSAPKSPEIYWYLDRMARNAAIGAGEEYDPPPQFIAVDPTLETTIHCAMCNREIGESAGIDEEAIRSGKICLVCFEKLSEERVKDQVDKYSGIPDFYS